MKVLEVEDEVTMISRMFPAVSLSKDSKIEGKRGNE
jgi:hypothetical protein